MSKEAYEQHLKEHALKFPESGQAWVYGHLAASAVLRVIV